MAIDMETLVDKGHLCSHQHFQWLEVMSISPEGFWVALQGEHTVLGCKVSWAFSVSLPPPFL